MSLDDDELSALIRRHATRHAAPAALRSAVATQAALARANRAAPPLAVPRPRGWRGLGWAGFAGLARFGFAGFGLRSALAGFALGWVCAFAVWPLLGPRLDLNPPLDRVLVADHVRALQIGPLIQVASSDRHTVKPWYQGRLDYAPQVFDLAAEGYLLSGGRVEQVRGQAVAALAYLRNKQVVDVYVWPASGPAALAPQHSTQRGFNVLHWSDGAMQVWAVSDAEPAELARLAQLWQARAAAP